MPPRFKTALACGLLLAPALAFIAQPVGAAEFGCGRRASLRSQNSDLPVRITFVNRSGAYRALEWIDFKGNFKDYGGMNPGESKVINTYVTHPWMITDGPGNCKYIHTSGGRAGTVALH
jgi:hypothetical protein